MWRVRLYNKDKYFDSRAAICDTFWVWGFVIIPQLEIDFCGNVCHSRHRRDTMVYDPMFMRRKRPSSSAIRVVPFSYRAGSTIFLAQISNFSFRLHFKRLFSYAKIVSRSFRENLHTYVLRNSLFKRAESSNKKYLFRVPIFIVAVTRFIVFIGQLL